MSTCVVALGGHLPPQPPRKKCKCPA